MESINCDAETAAAYYAADVRNGTYEIHRKNGRVLYTSVRFSATDHKVVLERICPISKRLMKYPVNLDDEVVLMATNNE